MVDEGNWDLFRIFFAVVRFGSVNKAAGALGLSQPTLSRRLWELEQYVGAPLFYRASSGVRLTVEGHELHRSAAHMVAAFETFHADLRSRVGKRASVVRLSCAEGLTKHWLLPRIRTIRDAIPGVKLEVISSAARENLVERDLDLVIRVGDPGGGELVGKRVGNLAFGIYGSQQYLERCHAPQSFADLDRHDLIAASGYPERVGTASTKLFANFGAAADKNPIVRIMPLANHYSAAAEGLGLACLAVPFADAEGLVRVLDKETGILGIWLLRRQESNLRSLTREVRKLLEREFAHSRPWLNGAQP